MNQIEFIVVSIFLSSAWALNSEEAPKKFIYEVDRKGSEFTENIISKRWQVDNADEASKAKLQNELDELNKEYDKYNMETTQGCKEFNWRSFENQELNRMYFEWCNNMYGEKALPDDELKELNKIKEYMTRGYNEARIKEFDHPEDPPKLTEDEVTEKVKSDYANVEEMKFYWKELHNTVGRPLKTPFTRWIQLNNKIAKLNGFSDLVDYWQSFPEVDYKETMIPLYKEILPFFKELHAYIRYQLWDSHGRDNNIIDPEGPIPASLLGWKWGFDAEPLVDRLLPYPDKKKLNITAELRAKNLEGEDMVKEVEKFFKSLGFAELPKDFYDESSFERKEGNMDCSGNTYALHGGQDYRVKICVGPTTYSYNEVVDYLSVAEYTMAYKDLPFLLRRTPGEPFKMALTSVIKRSAKSPKFLDSIGLLTQDIQLDDQQIINVLFEEALTNVFFLPYGLSKDEFRWRVAKGEIAPEHYNCEYWKLRTGYQGVEPPVERDNNDFDWGADDIWSILGGEYITYIIANFMEYDMMRALCTAAGYDNSETNPEKAMVFCDISNNEAIGNKLKEVMALGSSVPWNEALGKITGHNGLRASGLMEYFKPLRKWLEVKNKENKVEAKWNEGHGRCH